MEADVGAPGIPAGAIGAVTWVNLGPPVAYLVEFAGDTGAEPVTTKVQESHLSASH